MVRLEHPLLAEPALTEVPTHSHITITPSFNLGLRIQPDPDGFFDWIRCFLRLNPVWTSRFSPPYNRKFNTVPIYQLFKKNISRIRIQYCWQLDQKPDQDFSTVGSAGQLYPDTQIMWKWYKKNRTQSTKNTLKTLSLELCYLPELSVRWF